MHEVFFKWIVLMGRWGDGEMGEREIGRLGEEGGRKYGKSGRWGVNLIFELVFVLTLAI